MQRSVTTVSSIEIGKIVAADIVKKLEGKTFTLQNSHTGYDKVPDAAEGLVLKSSELVVSNDQIKIMFEPHKCLRIDLKERPVVIFVSDTQIRIERRLSSAHKIVQTILIQPECKSDENKFSDFEGAI